MREEKRNPRPVPVAFHGLDRIFADFANKSSRRLVAALARVRPAGVRVPANAATTSQRSDQRPASFGINPAIYNSGTSSRPGGGGHCEIGVR